MKYSTIDINGLDIFYRECGDQSLPTMILFHGFPSASHMFRDLMPILEDRFHVIAPDYPGFGQSESPDRENFDYITLREQPELKQKAAEWFHDKWGVPTEAYLACMNDYLSGVTEYGWFLCLDGERIVGGLGVIENDFHDRKDLSPNVCAVYTEEMYRGKGIAGKLLNKAVEDLRSKGITPVYLVTDHTGFYERYGWEFLCMVQGDGEPDMTRMYVHR